MENDKEIIRAERDEFKDTLFRITRLTKPETEKTLPQPVGGHENIRQRRLRLAKEARMRAAGDPAKRGWDEDAVRELENEVLGIQDERSPESTDSGTSEDIDSPTDSTKH